MVFVCHMISHEHVIKGWSNVGKSTPSPPMVSYQPASSSHRHCSSGDLKILKNTVISQQIWAYARFLPPLLFSLKHMACHVPHAS